MDGLLVRRGWGSDAGVRYVPAKALWGPLLYYLVLLFNLVVTFMIDEPVLGLVGVLIFIPITLMVLTLVVKPANQATTEEIAAHLRDFPGSPLTRWPGNGGIWTRKGQG